MAAAVAAPTSALDAWEDPTVQAAFENGEDLAALGADGKPLEDGETKKKTTARRKARCLIAPTPYLVGSRCRCVLHVLILPARANSCGPLSQARHGRPAVQREWPGKACQDLARQEQFQADAELGAPFERIRSRIAAPRC